MACLQVTIRRSVMDGWRYIDVTCWCLQSACLTYPVFAIDSALTRMYSTTHHLILTSQFYQLAKPVFKTALYTSYSHYGISYVLQPFDVCDVICDLRLRVRANWGLSSDLPRHYKLLLITLFLSPVPFFNNTNNETTSNMHVHNKQSNVFRSVSVCL